MLFIYLLFEIHCHLCSENAPDILAIIDYFITLLFYLQIPQLFSKKKIWLICS